MKKTYSKPALYAESFELAEHIALCSGYKAGVITITHWNDGVCTFQYTAGGSVLFNTTAAGTACDADYFPGMALECYNSPNGAPGVPFGS